jgi:hypothetical protein
MEKRYRVAMSGYTYLIEEDEVQSIRPAGRSDQAPPLTRPFPG